MTSPSLAVLGGLLAAFATPASAQSRPEESTFRAAPPPSRASLQQPAQTQNARNAPPAGAALLAPGTGSDSCATPDVISGTGTFNFNNGTATSSPEGQLTTNCIQYNQIGVPNDVWFLWTAPSSGKVEIGGCGSAGAIDTKIGVYLGSACPTPGNPGVACNDDFSLHYLQARVFFTAVQNQQYLIQIGVSPATPPGVPGADTFEIKYYSDTCAHDDGSSEVIVGLGATGGEYLWMNKAGAAGDSTIISAIETVWGSSWGPGVGAPPVVAGQAATVAVWDDPNDDGNPNDLVLVTSQATTIANPNSDVFQTVPLSSPVIVNGTYFFGAVTASGGGLGPVAASDEDSCGVAPDRSWRARQFPGTIDLNNLNASTSPPASIVNATGWPGHWLLRAVCNPATAGVPFCFGDGTGTLCPCSPAPVPHGAPGKGCPSNIFAGGAQAVATGLPSLAADTLVLTGSDMINGSMIFYQGATQQSGGAGAVFGDGKRCIQPTGIRRFKVKPVVGNTASYPGVGDNSVSVAGAVGAPGSFQYQGWYRSANPTFCTVATFNLTNGLTVTWLP